jgi:hypothetical protein
MQITQFVVGSLFASSNLFISYSVPVDAVPKGDNPSAAMSATSVSASIVTAAASAGLGSFLKRIVEENIAPAAPQQQQKPISYAAPSAPKAHETHYRTEHQAVRCLSTSGEAFAVWLNVVYLAPLTCETDPAPYNAASLRVSSPPNLPLLQSHLH